MSVKNVYIAVILLAVASFGLCLINVPLTYGLQGYSTDLIGSGSVEAFQADQATSPVRLGIFISAFTIDFVCFIFSLVAIFLQFKVNRILVWAVCILSFLFLLFYGLAFMVAHMGSICC